MKKIPKMKRAVKKHNGTIIEDGEDGFACQMPRQGYDLCIIVSYGGSWDHISLHARRGEEQFTPFWEDMVYVKSLFFKSSETVIQYHPKQSAYVNQHEHVLHLWRKQNEEFKLPPQWMV